MNLDRDCLRCLIASLQSSLYHGLLLRARCTSRGRSIYNIFSIKINDIVKCLSNLTDCSLYVDDFCICYRSKCMATIERQLQQNLNKIENWATSNGFKFSKSKTQRVHFYQMHKQHDDPILHLYGSPIQVVEESKFLGILFDRKLSFIPHIKYLKAKC